MICRPIQAAEATGPAKALMEPDTSQAMPTRSGGAGTRRRMVRVKGAAAGRAPAARWASAVRASRMRSRPGGVAECTVVAVRSGLAAARRARARRRAAAFSGSAGGRVPPAAAAPAPNTFPAVQCRFEHED
jgi:hypothetical protein